MGRGLFPSVTQGIAFAVALLSVVALASCSPVTLGGGNSNLDVIDKVRSIDTLPRYPQQAGAPAPDTRAQGQPAVFPGSEDTPSARPQSIASEAGEYEVADARAQPVALIGGGYELNFENTPVATVAKVVLGDILQKNY